MVSLLSLYLVWVKFRWWVVYLEGERVSTITKTSLIRVEVTYY